MIVTVDDDMRANPVFHPLDVIRWVLSVIDTSEAHDAYNVLDIIRESLENFMEENEGLPLVARIELTGDSEAYNTIAADTVRWLNEIRSLSLDLSGGSICIEKIKTSGVSKNQQVALRRGNDPQVSSSYDGPIGEIISFFDDLKSDPAQLQSLGETLNDLWKKLPRELKEISDINSYPDSFRQDLFMTDNNRNWLKDMLEQQVKPMLLNRLTP